MYRNVISIKREVAEEIAKTQMNVGIKVLFGVILGTPVDSGRAKGNWIVTQTRETDRTLPTPASKTSGANAAKTEGMNVLNQTRPYSRTYIQNNLIYINKLNAGYSAQAKPNYVDHVIFRVVRSG